MKLSTLIKRVIDWFYIKPVKKLIPHQTFRYAASGGLNMLLDLVLYYVIFHFLLCEQNLSIELGNPEDGIFTGPVISAHIAALGIVFPITFFNGFWLNRHVAFPGSPLPHGKQLLRYMFSVGGALLVNYLCMKLFVDVCGIFPTPSKALTTCVSVVYSYIMQKFFTFKGSPVY
ncbi:MAG: GtrA family protein [Rikenellaceae bacterium]|jgi:putative flippase GtrA|nr:GtrA family protein [Rikenellaceae bacterium]